MAAWQPAEILTAGLVTPVGLTAGSSAAAVRAGITRLRETAIYSRKLKPLLAGFLDEAHLPELPEEVRRATRTVTMRHQRMLRLAVGALREAARGCPVPPPLLLALPEPSPGVPAPGATDFLTHLMDFSGVPLDKKQSQLFPQGRAGGFFALQEALRLLSSGRVRHVLVGGVDSLLDLSLLSALDAEERLRGHGLSDGLIPGEGAAFLLLGLSERGWSGQRSIHARIMGVGTGHEEGHRYSEKPYRGEGLARAFQLLFESLPPSAPRVRCVYTGMNGESFWAKEWGVAYLRHARYFEEQFTVEHPVEFMGDPGAALAPMMVVLSALGMQKGYREAPCLVWCSSEREERGAALIHGGNEQS